MFTQKRSFKSWLVRAVIFLFLASSIPATAQVAQPGIKQTAIWQCWNWSPDPCAHELLSVSMYSSAEGWAVGEEGTILHWDGKQWTKQASPTIQALESVDVLSPTEAWAVGAEGTILHWNGHYWASVASPTTNYLTSVSMLSSLNGWAVGNHALLHWDGTQWRQDTSIPPNIGLASVAAISASDVWVAGSKHQEFVGDSGIMYHWNGDRWAKAAMPWSDPFLEGYRTFYSLAMISGSDGWALGWYQTGAESYAVDIFHWNGATWETRMTGTSANELSMVSATNGWAVGDGSILHWDGHTWTKILEPFISDYLYSVSIVSANEAWAVGTFGALWRWDGHSWRVMAGGYAAQSYLSSLAMVSARDGWAVGAGILHWDGTTWTRTPNPVEANLTAVALVPGLTSSVVLTPSVPQGWIVGYMGSILQLDGQSWHAVSSPVTTTLLAVTAISHLDAWAVGDAGTIIHWDGVAWKRMPSPTTEMLWSIAMVSADDGWASGGSGTLLHWDGHAWTKVANPARFSNITALAVVSANDVWALAPYDHIFLHWDGQRWSAVPIDTDNLVWTLTMRSPNNGWAGGHGVLLHWDGHQWSETFGSPFPINIVAIAMVSDTEGWAVGSPTSEGGTGFLHAVPGYLTYLPITGRNT